MYVQKNYCQHDHSSLSLWMLQLYFTIPQPGGRRLRTVFPWPKALHPITWVGGCDSEYLAHLSAVADEAAGPVASAHIPERHGAVRAACAYVLAVGVPSHHVHVRSVP